MKHLLFPVDFSERCEAARPTVAAWARTFGAKVTLIHTIQIPISAYGGADGYPIVIDIPIMNEAAAKRLDKFEMPDADRVVNMGDPAFEIVNYATEHGVDLIMMPTHGYGKFRSLLLGSVAAKVLHDAVCPVWTSAHTLDLSTPGSTEIRNILCDLGVESQASALAAAFGAKLQTESAVSPEGIRDKAIQYDADLVVISRGEIHETFGRLRSNVEAIIHESPCPVYSI